MFIAVLGMSADQCAVMVYFSVGAPWGYNISPGPHSTAMVAIFPLSVQIASSFLLPFGLGWLGGRVF